MIIIVLLVLGAGALSVNFVISLFRVDYGKIRLTSEPAGASITYDGKELGKKTPYTIKKVPTDDPHEVVLVLKGYQDVTEADITVSPDDTEQVHITLRPLPGSLRIVTDPPGAEVLLDGKLEGKSPLKVKDLDRSVSLPVLIQLDGYEEYNAIWTWEGKKRNEKLRVELKKSRRRRRRR